MKTADTNQSLLLNEIQERKKFILSLQLSLNLSDEDENDSLHSSHDYQVNPPIPVKQPTPRGLIQQVNVNSRDNSSDKNENYVTPRYDPSGSSKTPTMPRPNPPQSYIHDLPPPGLSLDESPPPHMPPPPPPPLSISDEARTDLHPNSIYNTDKPTRFRPENSPILNRRLQNTSNELGLSFTERDVKPIRVPDVRTAGLRRTESMDTNRSSLRSRYLHTDRKGEGVSNLSSVSNGILRQNVSFDSLSLAPTVNGKSPSSKILQQRLLDENPRNNVNLSTNPTGVAIVPPVIENLSLWSKETKNTTQKQEYHSSPGGTPR